MSALYAALAGADRSESNVLSCEYTDQAEFGPRLLFFVRRRAVSSAKMGRVLSKARLDKGNFQCCRVHPDQTSRGREGTNHNVMSGWADTVNSKVAPWGTFALAHRRPPCASMIDRQIDRPIPKPPDFVV